MTTRVFVEGAIDGALLGRLLEDLAPQFPFRIILSEGKDMMRPLARKSLITTREPVALVIDADTTDRGKAAAQLRDLKDYLAWSAGSTPFRVIQFEPEIECIFFQHPDVLGTLVGKTVKPELARIGANAPRAVLQTLLPGDDLLQRIQALPDEQVLKMTKSPQVAELREFLTSVAVAP